ncbi:MAG: 50S ribosomal protein L31 [Patescibacteria group bacterium]|jgi:large subunit ribosomal protein L31|nr:50S ribosomal protein L31 [Patescibacteria group bacterium]
MKKDIHPQYYPQAQFICACGNNWQAGSTQEKVEVEICSACHPFYTGQQKLVDTQGRVDKFKRRLEKQSQMIKSKAQKMVEKKEKKITPKDDN